MVLLVRHGQTRFNLEGRYQGRSDSPLTALGEQQAHAFGATLARLAQPPKQIWTSPLPRAASTAALIAQSLPGVTLRTEPRLQEMSFGQWDGLSKSEIKLRWPDARRGHGPRAWLFHAPDGEGLEPLRARLAKVLQEASDHPDLLLVSHGFSGRILRGLHAGLDFPETLALPASQTTIWQLLPGGAILDHPAT